MLQWYVAKDNANASTEAGFTSFEVNKSGMTVKYYDQVGLFISKCFMAQCITTSNIFRMVRRCILFQLFPQDSCTSMLLILVMNI